MQRSVPDGFAAFVDGSYRMLLRNAWLLTGNWASAEDLVQTALAATWTHWASARQCPAAYTRQVMNRTYLRWRKRRWTGELATADLPERSESEEPHDPSAGPVACRTRSGRHPAWGCFVMNVEEQRLADWLHEVTPEPPQAVTVEQVAERVAARHRAMLWLPAVAAAVAVMLVAALVFGLSRMHHAAPPANPATHGSISSAPSTSPPPSRSRGTQRPVTLPVHTWQARRVGGAALEPDSTAVLDGRLYALIPRSTRTGTSQLVRLDPRTGKVLARSAQVVSRRVRPVLADGLVWTVAAEGRTVLGFDPTTLAESTRVNVSVTGSADQGVALSLGAPLSAVLFGAGRTVAFVDPGHVLRTFTVDAPISGVALNARASRVYVAVAEGAGGRLETRDPRTGNQVGAPVATGPMLGLLPTAGGLWDTVAGGHEAHIEFRPANNLSAATSPRAGGSGGGQDIMPADTSGVAWLGGAGEVGCADAETGAMRATAPVGTGPHDSILGYIGGMTALDHKIYAAFTDSQDQTVLIEMTPPGTCFHK